MSFKRGLYNAALNTTPASVNQSNLAESRLMGGIDVLFNDRFDVARMKRVKIEGVFDGDLSYQVLIGFVLHGALPLRSGVLTFNF
jgi:hypothetical protein